MVKMAGMPWSGNKSCMCIDDMYKYTGICGLTNERLKTRIFDDTEVGNAIKEASGWMSRND